ncbi:MAG: hypothetical protein JNM78_12870 [Cyclobacteriaceae bacterium]|nr:hypothetical protein [Cyclobacteriaceae bacterium]
MKTLRVNKIAMLFFMLVGGTAMYGQNQPEVPGDQFSLEGALELFKKSTSPDEFERLLNSPNEKVNNLDLNGDGEIDYIRVVDRNKGNVHAFILSAVISESESQDIAVIELEKLANGKAVLQITGDADIYGIETIIEPTQEVRINAGTSTAQTVVNVWAWPSVQYVYSPYYTRWASPWHWGYRPVWWNPWRPIAYVDYYPYWTSYRPYYSVCHTHRVVYAQDLYRPYRSTSLVVYNRHHTQISQYRSTRGDDYGRSRDDDGRSSRQNNTANRNDNNGRGRSVSESRENNRSSANDWQRTDSNRRSSTDLNKPNDNNGRGRSVSDNRENSRSSANDGQRTENNRRSTNDWNKATDNNRRGSTVTRDESVLRNRSTSEVKRESPVSQQNNREVQRQDTRERSTPAHPVRQREMRPTPDTRSMQRSAPQMERKQTSSPNVQRSGSGGNKPADKKRGRD